MLWYYALLMMTDTLIAEQNESNPAVVSFFFNPKKSTPAEPATSLAPDQSLKKPLNEGRFKTAEDKARFIAIFKRFYAATLTRGGMFSKTNHWNKDNVSLASIIEFTQAKPQSRDAKIFNLCCRHFTKLKNPQALLKHEKARIFRDFCMQSDLKLPKDLIYRAVCPSDTNEDAKLVKYDQVEQHAASHPNTNFAGLHNAIRGL